VTIPANSAKTQKLPAAARPVFNDITAITRAFCTQHLDAEYAPAVRQAGPQPTGGCWRSMASSSMHAGCPRRCRSRHGSAG